MYLWPLLLALENAPVWSLAIHPSASFTVMKTRLVFLLLDFFVGTVIASDIAAYLFSVWISFVVCDLPRLDWVVVDLVPAGRFHGLFCLDKFADPLLCEPWEAF